MVLLGYPGIGKTTLAKKCPIIDLDSSRFFGKSNWVEKYCAFIKGFNEEGINVFASCHKKVREELKRMGIDYVVVIPSMALRDQWVGKLAKRYFTSEEDADFRAWHRATIDFEADIEDLMEEDKKLVIEAMDYDLEEMLKCLLL